MIVCRRRYDSEPSNFTVCSGQHRSRARATNLATQSVVPLTEGLFREAGKPELKGPRRQFPVADCSLRITLRNNLALTDIAGQIELHYPACR